MRLNLYKLFPDPCPQCGRNLRTDLLLRRTVATVRYCPDPACCSVLRWRIRSWAQFLGKLVVDAASVLGTAALLWLFACLFLTLGGRP